MLNEFYKYIANNTIVFFRVTNLQFDLEKDTVCDWIQKKWLPAWIRRCAKKH